MIENFLTTEQVAKILQVHPFTILKFIKQGKLRGVKLGRVYRMKESDVHEFLEGRMTAGSKVGKAGHQAPDQSGRQSAAQANQQLSTQYHRQPPQNTSLEHPEAQESEAKSASKESELVSRDTKNHREDHHHATPAHYNLKKDKNSEEGPPHYII
ncbi:helix-turn-helix domain-containing protein [Candidatus Peregrinibacteria bacterium]|nr:helix-turn-helix domain-containing protein [Candidatus Peregrinibacteria bacterium]